MTNLFELQKQDLRGDGRVVIYKRAPRSGSTSSKYQMRISTPLSTGYHRSSTKTNDLNEAKRIALNKYDELYAQVAAGNSLVSKKFSIVLDEWVADYQVTRQSVQKASNLKITTDRANNFIKTFFVEQAGNPRVDAVTESNISDYTNYRYAFEISPNTIRRELSILGQVLSFAHSKGYLRDTPKISLPKKVKSRRSTFSKEEYRKFYRVLRRNAHNQTNKRNLRRWFYLRDYCLVLANTGARVGEIRSLRWEHIYKTTIGAEERRVLQLKGKTGRRDAAINAGAERYLFRLYDFRTNELGHPPQLSEPVFCNESGREIGSYKKGFDAACEQAGVLYSTDGDKRSIYSLRHFYAHRRIIDGNVSVYELANHMGTSVELIQDHYGPQLNVQSSFRISASGHNQDRTTSHYPF